MKDRMELGEGIARQELNVLFVIDNSGSMEGEKIGAVNNAIRDVMSIMPEIQEDTSDAVIKIAALKQMHKPLALGIYFHDCLHKKLVIECGFLFVVL